MIDEGISSNLAGNLSDEWATLSQMEKCEERKKGRLNVFPFSVTIPSLILLDVPQWATAGLAINCRA